MAGIAGDQLIQGKCYNYIGEKDGWGKLIRLPRPEYLGKYQSYKLVGRPYDPDHEYTFERGSKQGLALFFEEVNPCTGGRRTRRKRGGGWAHGPPLSAQTYYFSENKAYNDCYDQARPGSIQAHPNPNLAQIAMAGGKRLSRRNRKTRKGQRGGCGCMLKRGGTRKYKARRKRTARWCTKTMRGGRYGFDISTSVGGDGPNVAPIVAHVPCEAYRPTPLNPTIPSMLANTPSPDLSVGSLRPAFIQNGGMMPGNSGHPLAYTEPTATYSFVPNISQGAALNPGMVPYQEVVAAPTSCISDCDAAIKAISGK